ncbi:MAG: bifunctional phosphoribosylaminoimidazolecarboxamide formyltransferase/IMP cyclohydrolase [Anaerolineae bacterium]
MPRALLSVSDKSGLTEFASALLGHGYDLVASGGTERALRDASLPVTSVEQVTGISEMLGGRVKTLHPAIFAGILARDREEDLAELRARGYAPITLVVCNLYPFQETVADQTAAADDAIEQIDIGGVTLLRAAAKSYDRVTVICDPSDYTQIADELDTTSTISVETRRHLASKAFAHTRDYDTAIHSWFIQQNEPVFTEAAMPAQLSLGLTLSEPLRYGENPHQVAAYYSRGLRSGPLGGTVLGGKQLSYNNILDLDAAWRAVNSFSAPTVVIVKHLNPCGIACGASIAEAYPHALAADPVSAFGGVIAVNREATPEFVSALGGMFVEAIVAPSFSSMAAQVLSEKRKNCRLLQAPVVPLGSEWEVRSVQRGFLVQRADPGDPELTKFTTATLRPPFADEVEALRFAWRAVQHVKSNAILLAKGQAAVGIGGGLTSRVDAVKLAIERAGDHARGAVLASDAFFPFADGVEAAVEAGVTAIIQPGGSIRDAEVIAAADKAGVAMIFTGVRHFRH